LKSTIGTRPAPCGWMDLSQLRRHACARAAMSGRLQMPVLAARFELVTQCTEAISLLAQNETAHRGIELDGLSERPECAEERHIRLLLLFSLGSGFGQSARAKRRGINQGVRRGRCRLDDG